MGRLFAVALVAASVGQAGPGTYGTPIDKKTQWTIPVGDARIVCSFPVGVWQRPQYWYRKPTTREGRGLWWEKVSDKSLTSTEGFALLEIRPAEGLSAKDNLVAHVSRLPAICPTRHYKLAGKASPPRKGPKVAGEGRPRTWMARYGMIDTLSDRPNPMTTQVWGFLLEGQFVTLTVAQNDGFELEDLFFKGLRIHTKAPKPKPRRVKLTSMGIVNGRRIRPYVTFEVPRGFKRTEMQGDDPAFEWTRAKTGRIRVWLYKSDADLAQAAETWLKRFPDAKSAATRIRLHGRPALRIAHAGVRAVVLDIEIFRAVVCWETQDETLRDEDQLAFNRLVKELRSWPAEPRNR